VFGIATLISTIATLLCPVAARFNLYLFIALRIVLGLASVRNNTSHSFLITIYTQLFMSHEFILLNQTIIQTASNQARLIISHIIIRKSVCCRAGKNLGFYKINFKVFRLFIGSLGFFSFLRYLGF